jgi:hypothetical protein
LEEAFEDNEAPAAAVGVDGAEVALVVLVPGPDAIPERLPGVTEAGNLSLRKTPKKAQAGFYAQMVAGHVLVTIREAFVVAPNLAAARAVAMRTPGHDAYGRARVECLLATRVTRTSLEGVRWNDTDAGTVLNDTNSELLINQKGQAKEIQPLDLTAEPELIELLSRVDAEALAANRNA